MSKAESSAAGARHSIKPSSDEVLYDLPWYVSAPLGLRFLANGRPRVEKYRPVYLDDIVGNTETIERLKIIAKDGNMPHVIISGMPGIGKTTSILCLARQLLGDAYKEAVLELNASDERGKTNLDRCFLRNLTNLHPTQASMLSATASKALLKKKSHFPQGGKNWSSSTKPTGQPPLPSPFPTSLTSTTPAQHPAPPVAPANPLFSRSA